MHNVDKQYAVAVILIILGLGLNQSGSSNPFYSGLGIGIIAMGTFWVLIRLILTLNRSILYARERIFHFWYETCSYS